MVVVDRAHSHHLQKGDAASGSDILSEYKGETQSGTDYTGKRRSDNFTLLAARPNRMLTTFVFINIPG